MKAYEIILKNKENQDKLKKSPWLFISAFGSDRCLDVLGDQISFGEDYLSLQEARQVVEYLVNELGGGKVKWSTSSKKRKTGE